MKKFPENYFKKEYPSFDRAVLVVIACIVSMPNVMLLNLTGVYSI